MCESHPKLFLSLMKSHKILGAAYEKPKKKKKQMPKTDSRRLVDFPLRKSSKSSPEL